MRIVTRTGICKTPSGTYYLDVGGTVNIDSILNIRGNLLLDSTATIEAAVGSGGDVSLGTAAETTILNFGTGAHAKTITIGNTLDTVTIRGNTIFNNVTNANILDALITLNKGGGVASASDSGFELEENAAISGYFKTSADRAAFVIKSPARSGILRLQASANAFTHTILSSNTSDQTWTLPNTTDTFAGLSSSQTFTNKTLTSAIINGSTNISGTETNTAASTYSNTQTFSGSTALNGTNTVGGATTFNSTVAVNGATAFNAPTSGFGVVPLGGVIAIFNNLSGAFSVPASGSVSSGWQRADGAAIPSGNTVSGTTPNISDGRFIRGASTSGSAVNDPGHTHSTTINSGLSSSSVTASTATSFAGGAITVSVPGHSHGFSLSADISHNHGAFNSASAGSHTHVAFAAGSDDGGSNSFRGVGNGGRGFIGEVQVNAAGAHQHSIDMPAFAGPAGTGTVNGSVGSGVSGNAAFNTSFTANLLNSQSQEHTHSIAGLTTNGTGTSTNSKSEPSYINAVYLIRVR